MRLSCMQVKFQACREDEDWIIRSHCLLLRKNGGISTKLHGRSKDAVALCSTTDPRCFNSEHQRCLLLSLTHQEGLAKGATRTAGK